MPRTLYVAKKLDRRSSRQAADLDKHFHLVLPQAALVVTSAQHHLPIVYAYRIFVNAGDLISLSGGDVIRPPAPAHRHTRVQL